VNYIKKDPPKPLSVDEYAQKSKELHSLMKGLFVFRSPTEQLNLYTTNIDPSQRLSCADCNVQDESCKNYCLKRATDSFCDNCADKRTSDGWFLRFGDGTCPHGEDPTNRRQRSLCAKCEGAAMCGDIQRAFCKGEGEDHKSCGKSLCPISKLQLAFCTGTGEDHKKCGKSLCPISELQLRYCTGTGEGHTNCGKSLCPSRRRGTKGAYYG